MFPGSTNPELETGFLRSGRRFISGKRRKIEEGRRTPNLFEESEDKIHLQVYEGSCNEEEDYSLISEGEEDSKESGETRRSGHNYITPRAPPEVRSRASSPE